MSTQPTPKDQERKDAFLAAFAEGGMIANACKKAGCTRAQVFEWAEDPAFRSAMGAAKQEALEALEAEAFRRAIHGVEKQVYYKGTRCGTIREYSDDLLKFLLESGMPAKYGAKRSTSRADPPRRRTDDSAES